MEITRLTDAGQFTLKLKGRMDAVWSDHAGRALADCARSGQHRVRVDMAQVDYISSAGIRILVIYAKQLRAIGGQLAVVNASEMVRKVLTMAGLESLLLEKTGAAPAETPAEAASRPRSLALSETGASAEVFELEPKTVLHLDGLGQPQLWLEGRGDAAQCQTVEFGPRMIGLGLGGFGGGEAGSDAAFGEFLAAGGAAVCQPADGAGNPDYMIQQGELTPAVRVAYGLVARGEFACLVRFDKGTHDRGVSMSSVAKACLQAAGGGAAGFVMVAETAFLVGASLQKMPGPLAPASGAAQPPQGELPPPGQPSALFAFPGVRDHLNFTAETAFADSVSLVVGFVADPSRAASLKLLKPLDRAGRLTGHFHAAAFPYRPLRKGKVALADSVLPLFEHENVLGVLHLLNDWRDANGAGESLFLRGACWCAPLEV